ncbi:hypothetical protein FC25_GL000358 [Ligilactobacillus ruminis DSM 20403 = NBRC 102161]|nr:hypothetical protein FC25_GL000358 [Ligilactobacillus ruminis DSM 20403 = NBRC 102161]
MLLLFSNKKSLRKNDAQIEKPDDLQSIANHPVFFIFMTIACYGGNNSKDFDGKFD